MREELHAIASERRHESLARNAAIGRYLETLHDATDDGVSVLGDGAVPLALQREMLQLCDLLELPARLVDFDAFLEKLVAHRMVLDASVEPMLAALFVAGDVNGDGHLSIDEFKAIIRSAVVHMPSNNVLCEMYAEALVDQHDEYDSSGDDDEDPDDKEDMSDFMTIESFCRMAKRRGLLMFQPSKELKRKLGRAAAAQQEKGIASGNVGVEDELTLLRAAWGDERAHLEESLQLLKGSKAFDTICERVDHLEALIGEQGPAGGKALPKAGGKAVDKVNVEAAWMTFRMLLLEVKREVGNRKVTKTMAAKPVESLRNTFFSRLSALALHTATTLDPHSC